MIEKLVLHFESMAYFGAYVSMMKAFKNNNNLLPVNVKDIIMARLDIKDKLLRHDLNWNVISTVDAGIRTLDGKLKIVYDAEKLKNLFDYKDVCGRGVPLFDDELDSLEGDEFSKRQVGKYTQPAYLDKLKVKENPIWLSLVRGDKPLLSEYVDYIFHLYSEGKFRFNSKKINELMKISVHSLPTVREDVMEYYAENLAREHDLPKKIGLMAPWRLSKVNEFADAYACVGVYKHIGWVPGKKIKK